LRLILVKFVPILGTIVLLGAIVQVLLGFQVAADVQGLRDIHVGVGILGLVLVMGLTVLAFRAGVVYSKITMTILVIIVLVQIIMGFELLRGNDALLFSHEANAFLIVALSLLTGGVTFWSGMKRTRISI
jgi:hypothetical protein